jgi:hypothetical protein
MDSAIPRILALSGLQKMPEISLVTFSMRHIVYRDASKTYVTEGLGFAS